MIREPSPWYFSPLLELTFLPFPILPPRSYLPSPLDIDAVQGCSVDDVDVPMTRDAADNAPFSGLAFKIMTDPFVGSLTFVRIYSGTLEAGTYVLNPAKGKKERVGRLMVMHANNREDIK